MLDHTIGNAESQPPELRPRRRATPLKGVANETGNLWELGFDRAAIVRPWAPPQDDRRYSSMCVRSSLEKKDRNMKNNNACTCRALALSVGGARAVSPVWRQRDAQRRMARKLRAPQQRLHPQHKHK